MKGHSWCLKLAGSICWLWIRRIGFLCCQVARKGCQFVERRLWVDALLSGVLSALVSAAPQMDKVAPDDTAAASSSVDSSDGAAISISSMTGALDDSGSRSGSAGLPASPAGR